MTVTSPGKPYPLGATFDGNGTNFAIFSAHASKVELCLFDADTEEEIERITFTEYTDEVWHAYIANIKPGTLYGYRVYGPYDPHHGHRFNPHKLLLDPYAKQLNRSFGYSKKHYGFDTRASQRDLILDTSDNADVMPKCVVTEKLAGLNSRVDIADNETIIYEAHVKGFTQLNPEVPVQMRGTFKALSQPSVIQYLQDLAITSIELLPVQAFFDESFVLEKGLKNYWGYNSIGFFAPEPRYCHTQDLSEFQQMVQAFHQAGIQVILDVVYNHTAEGNHLGPTYSFKGIDNKSYYRLDPVDNRFYLNFSGCGNTLNLGHPRVLQLVMDSLRYWVDVMGVDGFRFDLATILGRKDYYGNDSFFSHSSFFAALKQDPTLAGVKLIAEPWDIGTDGYKLGQFPGGWSEWNDRFRDAVRRFWRGDENMLPELASRLHGSADLFEHGGRRPFASINYVTAHDGYTLHDLVTYEKRHNEANGEGNHDGHDGNFSCNYGVEGETSDPTINRIRTQQKRNILATLFLSQGSPMLLAGDERNHSQRGNNNAYCQDNELTWFNWQTESNEQVEFVKQLIQFRKNHPLLNRLQYQHGHTVSKKTGLKDLSWFNCHGEPMNENNWVNRSLKCFALLLADTEHSPSKQQEHQDDALMIIFNAHDHECKFQLPEIGGDWSLLLNTADDKAEMTATPMTSTMLTIDPYSCTVYVYNQK
ncbi:glycogen debranching protein GlgX [Thalassotalea aquiviva]|uniref:glycogen debranching protein GlgX n=1 Tax=Thalassotalea aquiviva TaxID=3242415 RepID=UPI00352AA404